MKPSRWGAAARVVVVATGAALIALAGVAVAAIPGPEGTVRGCYVTGGGGLRVVDSGVACKSNKTLLTWSQRGPAGA